MGPALEEKDRIGGEQVPNEHGTSSLDLGAIGNPDTGPTGTCLVVFWFALAPHRRDSRRLPWGHLVCTRFRLPRRAPALGLLVFSSFGFLVSRRMAR